MTFFSEIETFFCEMLHFVFWCDFRKVRLTQHTFCIYFWWKISNFVKNVPKCCIFFLREKTFLVFPTVYATVQGNLTRKSLSHRRFDLFFGMISRDLYFCFVRFSLFRWDPSFFRSGGSYIRVQCLGDTRAAAHNVW